MWRQGERVGKIWGQGETCQVKERFEVKGEHVGSKGNMSVKGEH